MQYVSTKDTTKHLHKEEGKSNIPFQRRDALHASHAFDCSIKTIYFLILMQPLKNGDEAQTFLFLINFWVS
jgi:hypothetical protein